MTLPGIRQFDLKGKKALITGGSKGLGEAMAYGLASAGADVAIVSRHIEEAKAVAQEIAKDYGCASDGFVADVSKPDQVAELKKQVESDFGAIDVLVNNAGINIRGSIDELSFEEFQRVHQVNVDGVWLCTKAFVADMRTRGGGRVINLASTLGLVGLQNRTPYTSSKGAVVQMTRALALELAKDNILVNAICPGPFLTPMNQPIADSEEAKRFIVGAVALERWGRMEEIQGVAIFLASDAASYVTGSIIPVDGGWTAR